MDTEMIIAICISVVLAGYGVYQYINICRSEPVEATLIGYEESSRYDPNLGYEVDEKFPVYEFYYHERRMRYESKISAIPFFKNDRKTLYVNEKEHVYEMQSAWTFMITALIPLVLGYFI